MFSQWSGRSNRPPELPVQAGVLANGSTPGPQARPAAQQLSNASLELKLTIHRRLLDSINLAAIEKMPKEQFQREVGEIIRELLREEGTWGLRKKMRSPPASTATAPTRLRARTPQGSSSDQSRRNVPHTTSTATMRRRKKPSRPRRRRRRARKRVRVWRARAGRDTKGGEESALIVRRWGDTGKGSAG